MVMSIESAATKINQFDIMSVRNVVWMTTVVACNWGVTNLGVESNVNCNEQCSCGNTCSVPPSARQFPVKYFLVLDQCELEIDGREELVTTKKVR
jgi:hypothetical protein